MEKDAGTKLIVGIAVVILVAFILVTANFKKFVNLDRVNPSPANEEALPTSYSTASLAPLPGEEDIIRTFFNLIDKGRAADAVGMMTVTDEGEKQTWAVQFNAINHVVLDSIEPSMQEEWSNDKHTYKVTLTVSMKSEAASAVIPNYGWENGTNIRWIPIEKVGNIWKIVEIATGP